MHTGPYALQRVRCRKCFGVSRRSFHAGLRILTQSGVIGRVQPNRRTWAVETLADGGPGHVQVPVAWLTLDATMLAFMVAVRLSPDAANPKLFAARIGITSPATIRRLVDDAERLGSIERWLSSQGAVVVARPGVKTGHARTGHAHTKCKTTTLDGHSPETNRIESLRATIGGTGSVLRLVDWRNAALFQELLSGRLNRTVRCSGASLDADVYTSDVWNAVCNQYPGIPEHLRTRRAHCQILEVAGFIHELGEGYTEVEVLHALANQAAIKAADGKTIRSVAFMADALVRDLVFKGESRGHMSGLELLKACSQSALVGRLAAEICDAAEAIGYFVNRDALTAQPALNELYGYLTAMPGAAAGKVRDRVDAFKRAFVERAQNENPAGLTVDHWGAFAADAMRLAGGDPCAMRILAPRRPMTRRYETPVTTTPFIPSPGEIPF